MHVIAVLLGLVAAQVAAVVICAVWLEQRLHRRFNESNAEFWRRSDALLNSTAEAIAEEIMKDVTEESSRESERRLASVSDIPPR